MRIKQLATIVAIMTLGFACGPTGDSGEPQPDAGADVQVGECGGCESGEHCVYVELIDEYKCAVPCENEQCGPRACYMVQEPDYEWGICLERS